MKRIAIFGNKSQRSNFDSLQAFFDHLALRQAEITLIIDRRYYEFMQRVIRIPRLPVEILEPADELNADLVLSIGGDGSFLTTANRVGRREIPIMGINSGHLGYLAAADITDSAGIIDDIISGQFDVQPRSVIAVESDTDQLPARPFALNEVAILKQHTASMITVHTMLDGAPLVSYRSDGLIVSTPTGSTGYNLSVGGPIVAPTAHDWIISPIAPHSLNMRPLVLPDTVVIDAVTESRSASFLLSIDGKAVTLPINTALRLVKAPYVVNLVIPRMHNFVDTLRHKLLWGMDGR